MPRPKKKEWTDWLNVKVLQKAVVVDEEDNMLAIRREETGFGARLGMWDLPGGSMSLNDLKGSAGKPHKEAIAREIKEETGLDVDGIDVVYADSGIKETKSAGNVLIMAIGYRCRIKGVKPSVTLSEEHIESKWVPEDEFSQLDFGDDGGFHSSVVKQA